MNDLFLRAPLPFEAGDAVAAILLDGDGRYVMQHRDDLPQIFFPGHWGCFGGAVEAGEAPEDALCRELREELDLRVEAPALRYFTRMDLDFAALGSGRVFRLYYEIRITREQGQALRLLEGQAVRHFDGAGLLLHERITPYDAFVLWMHVRSRAP